MDRPPFHLKLRNFFIATFWLGIACAAWMQILSSVAEFELNYWLIVFAVAAMAAVWSFRG